jgi:hypothetical protein
MSVGGLNVKAFNGAITDGENVYELVPIFQHKGKSITHNELIRDLGYLPYD